MTFYELNGLLGREQPIFHLTTGSVRKAAEGGGDRKTSTHQMDARVSRSARGRGNVFTLLAGSGGHREAGVKAAGRKDRVLV